MKDLVLYGIPELASQHGEMVDHMLLILHYFMGILFIFWSTFLVFALIRYWRRNNPRADYHGIRSHWSSHVEAGVVIVEGILLLGFAFPLWGLRSEAYPTGDDVLRLRAVGEKFLWTFHYPGEDGKFGRVDPFFFSSDNVLGIDPDDPNGRDDLAVRNEMALPLDRDVVVEVAAKDVIHNLALHPMRMAQDAIPGMRAHVWFKPTEPGTWDIICGQLCGAQHANMKATLNVFASDAESDSEEKFAAWLASQQPVGPAIAPQTEADAVPAPGTPEVPQPEDPGDPSVPAGGGAGSGQVN